MLIKSTHRLEFSNGTEKFLTAGGNVEQEAPDWIAEDDYFKANLADGRVTRLASPVVDVVDPVVVVVTQQPTPEPVANPAPESKPAPEKPKRGKVTEQPSVTEPAFAPAPAAEKQVVDTGIPGF